MIKPISGKEPTQPITPTVTNPPSKTKSTETGKALSDTSQSGVVANFSKIAQQRSTELLETKFEEASESNAQKATEKNEPVSPQSLINGKS